jgi:hypothetical protein
MPLNGLPYHLQFLRKTEQFELSLISGITSLKLLLKRRMSPMSYSKDWGHDAFNGRVYLCFSIGLKYGLLSHQTRCLILMLKGYVPLYSYGIWENTNTNTYL